MVHTDIDVFFKCSRGPTPNNFDERFSRMGLSFWKTED